MVLLHRYALIIFTELGHEVIAVNTLPYLFAVLYLFHHWQPIVGLAVLLQSFKCVYFLNIVYIYYVVA
jgi:hypothetical protein